MRQPCTAAAETVGPDDGEGALHVARYRQAGHGWFVPAAWPRGHEANDTVLEWCSHSQDARQAHPWGCALGPPYPRPQVWAQCTRMPLAANHTATASRSTS